MSHPNPKIIHRIYFTNFKPFHDPFDHYLDTWHEQMPGYKIMKWGIDNLDVYENKWTRRAFDNSAPVFLSEYFRWKLLSEFGGLYLDADCEIVDGPVLHQMLEDLYSQDDYDVFFGVEERENGHPTAQTFAAKPGAKIVEYMKGMYENSLAPLWHWRERRGLIGPQLLSLYFLDQSINVADDGFFKNIDEPTISSRAKIFPQVYFSPKFSILGDNLDYEPGKTCVYHMFANSNVDFSDSRHREDARTKALKFHEYRAALERANAFPRHFDADRFNADSSARSGGAIVIDNPDGSVFHGPYISLPPGTYQARLHLPSLPHRGKAEIRATARAGQAVLATLQLVFGTKRSSADVALLFVLDRDNTTDIEFTMSAGKTTGRLSFTGVTIDQQAAGDGAPAIRPIQAIQPEKGLKILHRIYFGFDGKPDPLLGYLKTWEEQLPDFQIMHWNTSNLPMDINAYVQELHAERDHAFLTDFFRWYVLREHGGTYLDADMEVVDGGIYRALIEELAFAPEIEAFIGIDDKKSGWYTAHSMASKPGSEITRFMCDVYANFGKFTIWRKKGMYFWAPQMTALYFASRGYHKDGMGTSPNLDRPIVVAGVKIYPQDWFGPLAPTGDARTPFVLSGLSPNTCLCHHFACSWHDTDSPYLAHSLKSGGQSNVLLKELILRRTNRIFEARDELFQTEVGLWQKNGIRSNGKAGRLAYGPYLALEPGAYNATFHLEDVMSSESVVVDVSSDSGNVRLAKQALSSRDAFSKITVAFYLDRPVADVEFRVTVGKRSSIVFSRVELDTAN